MTTLLYQSGIIYADTRLVTTSDQQAHVAGSGSKLPNFMGRQFAICGYVAQATAYALAVASDKRLPRLDASCQVIELLPDGGLEIHEAGASYQLPRSDEAMAWGSGASMALVGAHLGAQPLDIMRAVAKVDLMTGSPFEAVRYDKRSRSFVKWSVEA
mgnify:CR=1 FL=1